MKKAVFLKNNKGVISEEKKREYLVRLQTEYTKNGVKKSFREQFDKGSGREIKNGKFWSKKSSSRLAFDLYSWRAESTKVFDFEFEKRLPGIRYKGKNEAGYPNMDVYFETNDEITFIESKLSETPPDKIQLAEAYWIESDTYHTTRKDKDTKEYKTNTYPLILRYRGNQKVSNTLVNFFKSYINVKPNENEWFDFAQEMKHLFGIVFYVIENKEDIHNRRINFYNTVYQFDEYQLLGKDSKSDLAKKFVKEATELISKLFKSEGISSVFSYELKFVQSELALNGSKLSYKCNKTVSQLINENFDFE